MSAPNRFAQAVQRPAPQPVAVPAPPQARKYTILLNSTDLTAIDEDLLRLQRASGLRVDRPKSFGLCCANCMSTRPCTRKSCAA